MSTPPVVPVSSGPAAAQPSVPTATVTNPPPDLGQAANGTILRGSVVGRSQGGELLVRTEQGVLSLRTPQNLQPGTTVRLEIQTAGNAVNVAILSAVRAAGTGAPAGPPAATLPPPAPGAALGGAAQGAAAGGAALASGEPATVTTAPGLPGAGPLAPGAVVRAQVVPSSGAAPATPPGAPSGSPSASASGTPSAPTVPTSGTPPTLPAPASGTTPTPLPVGAPPSAPSPAPAGAVPQAQGAGAPATAGAPAGQGATASTGASPAPASVPTAAAGGAVAGAPAAAAPAGVAGLPSGLTTLRIVDIVPPPGMTGAPSTAAGATAAAATGGPVVTGTVIGATPGGQPLLQLPGGLAVLAADDLPVGTRVSVEPAPAGGAAPAPRAPLPLPALAAQWGTLGEALAALHQVNPAAVQTLVGGATGGGQLTAGLMLFMSVLGQGDFKAWLGERPLAALQRSGGRDLVDRLGEEFHQLSRAANGEASRGEWRGYFIPIYDGSALSQLRLFVHPHGGEPEADGSRSGPEGARFILDVDLTRLGQVQLDGLVETRPDEHGRPRKQLDLIVRTPRALPAEMRRDIHDIFERTTGAGGLAGSIAFRAQPKMPPLPVAEVAGHVPSTLV